MYSTFHHVEPLETLLAYLRMCEGDPTQAIVDIKRVVYHAYGYENGGNGKKWRCPHSGWPSHKEELEPHIDCMAACKAGYFDFRHRRAIGMTVSMRERNMHDDSDFLCTNFVPGATPEEDRFETVEYATTRGWTYYNGACIDMTPQSPWFERFVACSARMRAREVCRYDLAQAQKIDIGKRVRVAKGRKFPLGLTGTVLRMGSGDYGPWALVDWDEPQAKGAMCSAENLIVIDYAEPDFEAVLAKATDYVRREWLEVKQ